MSDFVNREDLVKAVEAIEGIEIRFPAINDGEENDPYVVHKFVFRDSLMDRIKGKDKWALPILQITPVTKEAIEKLKVKDQIDEKEIREAMANGKIYELGKVVGRNLALAEVLEKFGVKETKNE
jgi:hypothetical protein